MLTPDLRLGCHAIRGGHVYWTESLAGINAIRERLRETGGMLAEENERLRILTKTNDGFLVAQKDLELRGPGDLMGTRQSGEMLQGFLLDGDVKLLEEAASCMKQLRADPALQEERAAVESTALSCYGERLKQVALN